MKRILGAFLLLLPSFAWGQVPSLIQSHSTARENTPGTQNGYTNPQLKIALPNPSLGRNCLILGVSANSNFLTISTPTDNQGNVWNVGPSITANGLTTSSFYALNIAGGTSLITVSFTGTVPSGNVSKLSDSVQEFSNCQISGAIGPTGIVSSASPVNVTLSAAPALGDLVWLFGEDSSSSAPSAGDCSNSGPALTSITKGTNYTLAAANRYQGKLTEYSTTTTSPTAGFVTSGADTFNAVALTLHAASAGTSALGVRIVHEQGEWFHTGSHTIQFPSSGTMLLGAWLSPDVNFSSISSSPGSTWNTGDISPVCCSQIFYTLTPSVSADMTITPTYSGTSQGCDFLQMYDIAGGNFLHDTVDLRSGNQTSNGNLTSGVITPSMVGEFIINITGLSFHSMLGTVTDSNGHTPTPDFTANTKNDDANGGVPSQLNDDDGRAHIISTDTLPITFIYNYVALGSPAGVQGWNSVTSSFKLSSVALPAPPTNLRVTSTE